MTRSRTYLLPIPPSVNNLYAGKERRYPSGEYKAWKQEAMLRLNQQKITPIDGPVEVHYEYGRFNDKRRRDLANREKGLSDLLVSCYAMGDDCNIQKAVLEWSDEVDPGMVRATIRALA